MAFTGAQVFYVDSSLMASVAMVGISKINLYFRNKPQANNNKSGIFQPGVTLYLAPTANGVPVVEHLSDLQWSRVSYTDVNASSDASLPTTFRFSPAVQVPTDKDYAFILAYDGDEDFVAWNNVKGDNLVGTTTPSPGSASRYVGGYYNYISDVASQPANTTATDATNMVQVGNTATTTNTANVSYTTNSWRPKSDTTLKFDVFVSRYKINGNTSLATFVDPRLPGQAQIIATSFNSLNANGEHVFNLPSDRMEYISYDIYNSNPLNVQVGEKIFQNTVPYPGGKANAATINVANGSVTITSDNTVNWNNILRVNATTPEYLVIQSSNHNGAGADITNVRQVVEIVSNTVIKVDAPLTFTNTVANFFRSPIATVDSFKRAKFFGTTQSVLIAKRSTANSSMRFTPYSVSGIAIANGGTGYANTDTVRVRGFESVANKVLGNYEANAQITTNANGTITSVALANLGSGFVNSAAISVIVANTTGTNSVGTGANLTITIGSTVKAEMLGQTGAGGYFTNCHPINIEVGDTMPALTINNPAGTFYRANIRFPYYSVDDVATTAGKTYYCDTDGNWDVLDIQTMKVHRSQEFTKRRILPSWSNEFHIPYANGLASGALGGSNNTIQNGMTSNASVIQIIAVSNNDFVAPAIVPSATKVTYSRYIINNDYTDEHTNYGAAWAKGIEVKFALANNSLAEDLLLYATVYKPPGTNIVAYARLYNGIDNDSFDSKDWTLLDLKDGIDVNSSVTNLGDVFEMTWGLKVYPDIQFTLTGSVTTQSGNSTIVGQGTDWSSNTTANLVAGDMVVLRNPLFSNTYQVAIVNSVANNTQLVLNNPVANLNMVGAGFTISKVALKHQAFSNRLNDNVARYYSTTLLEADGFDTVQVKMILLSNNGLLVPMIDDIRAVCVSA